MGTIIRLLLWVALNALKPRDVSQVDWMFERFVRLVTGIAFSIYQATEIDRVLDVDCQWNFCGPGRV